MKESKRKFKEVSSILSRDCQLEGECLITPIARVSTEYVLMIQKRWGGMTNSTQESWEGGDKLDHEHKKEKR